MNINVAVKEDRQRYVQLENANYRNLQNFLDHSANYDNPEELCVAVNIMYNLTNISLNTQKNFQSIPVYMAGKPDNKNHRKLVECAYHLSNEYSCHGCIDWLPAINQMESLLLLMAKDDEYAEVSRYFQMIKSDVLNMIEIYLA